MSRAKNWCFTLNNPTNDEHLHLVDLGGSSDIRYLCFQRESGSETETDHFQGFVSFRKQLRLSAAKRLISSRVHLEVAKGTPEQNREYCSKTETAVSGTFEEYGELPESKAGTRTDFQAFLDAVENGLREQREARVRFPELTAKYPRWCYDILADQQEPVVADHPELRDWQKDLLQTLQGPPDDRTITFVFDAEGGKGKTWFAKWYAKQHSDAQIIEPAKKVDMAHALRENLRVLFLNVTRTKDSSQHEYLYSFVESVKDGAVFSPKYESRMKYYENVHVVVMLNQPPDMDLLSPDRYNILHI
ncbi:hypothetical protein ACQZV8_21155 [Magnetococcales bacterium HHB-1]